MITQQLRKPPWSQMMLPPAPAQRKKRRARWRWRILVAVTGIVMLLLAIGAAVNSRSNSTSVTQQATYTPVLTLTPDLTTSRGIEQYTLQLAQYSGASGSNMSTHYNANYNAIIVKETLGVQPDNYSTKINIENDCFAIQRAIWKSTLSLSVVEVRISGPIVDQQGNTTTRAIGVCAVKEKTARAFNWNNLTYNQAWKSYDATWMHPSLNQ